MPDETSDTWDEPGDDGVLDDADTLASDDLTHDPLDDAVEIDENYSAGEGWGTTEAEARQGESLDMLLSEEEPDLDLESADPSSLRADPYAPPDEEAGRLIPEDGGVGPDRAADDVEAVATADPGGRTAEESAMHIRDEHR